MPGQTRGGLAGFLNVRMPFFRPAWRRALATGVVLAWALVEFRAGNTAWGLLALGAALYLAYQFFVVFDPADYADGSDTGSDEGEASQ